MCSSSPPIITEQAHSKIFYQTVETEWTGNLTKSLSSCVLRPLPHPQTTVAGPDQQSCSTRYNQLVMKSGEGREVESGGVILPTPVFDMCMGPGQLPTPGHIRSTHHNNL